jgi:exodeoxyribonuclease-3
MPVTFATWNINSVRLRLPIVLGLLSNHGPDIVCLQEIKCLDEQFPREALADAGYPYQAVNGQKGYHGVAIISKRPLSDIDTREFCAKGDSRHISALVDLGAGPVRIHNFYIPAGGDEPDPVINPKFRHKLDFLSELRDWFDGPEFSVGHLIAGDFNIAPHENDVWSHKQLLKVVSHTPVETEALDAILARRPWTDLVRKHIPIEEKIYSWWSYRAKDWDAADKGRRLDHIWATGDIAALSTGVEILRSARGWSEKPSDHVPVLARFG